jgi:hypothetical protein
VTFSFNEENRLMSGTFPVIKKGKLRLESSSVGKCLPSIPEALGSIFSTFRKKIKRKEGSGSIH